MRDVRCPSCQRLLCRIDGRGTAIELKCKGGLCKVTVHIDQHGNVDLAPGLSSPKRS